MSLKKIFAVISLSTILLFLSYSLYSTFVSVSASENTYTNYYNLSESEQYILNHHRNIAKEASAFKREEELAFYEKLIFIS